MNEEAIKLLEEIKKAAGKWPKDVFYFIKADQALALLKPKCATCGGSRMVKCKCCNAYVCRNDGKPNPCPDCKEQLEAEKGKV